MRGEESAEKRRYLKFVWNGVEHVPPIGQTGYVPPTGAFRMFQSGSFTRRNSYRFAAQKERRSLPALGFCVYCGVGQDKEALTSEHIIPEFLGAGLELPESSCSSCQAITSRYENSLADDIFGSVRRSLGITGKKGPLKKGNFDIDVGLELTDRKRLPILDHPTIITLPNLFPASRYSRRPPETHAVFNLVVHNLNAEVGKVEGQGIKRFATCHIDLVRLCQLIGKIAYVIVVSEHRKLDFDRYLIPFLITDFQKEQDFTHHFDSIGGIWNGEVKSSYLHEIDTGLINWNGLNMMAARVRLFSCYDMPTYYVAVGH